MSLELHTHSDLLPFVKNEHEKRQNKLGQGKPLGNETSLSQNSGLQAIETQVKPISAEIGTQGGCTVELHKLGVPGM